MTAAQLISEALQELGIGNGGEALSNEDKETGLQKLARLVDRWNAKRAAIFADTLLRNALTPSLQPHTIGPTGTWTVSQRPVSIDGDGTLFLASGVTLPITQRTMAWYQGLPAPTLTTGEPTDFVYNPEWPNGSIYFWPVPTSALQVQLRVRGILSAFALSTTFSMPPGYRDALTLTLAEECAPLFGMQAKPSTVLSATKARAEIFSNNTVMPPLVTAVPGMPGRRGGWFDHQTGMVR